MAFIDTQFPPRISAGAEGGPVWSTAVSKVANGTRGTNRLFSAPLHRFNVSHAVRQNDLFEILRSFFYIAGGRDGSFRYKDWTDFQATQANSRCSFLTGSTTHLQLQRLYAYGGYEFERDITKPVSGSAQVFRTRSGATNAIGATIDYSTGVATISGHVSGDTYTWTGEFDVQVAFESDAAMWRAIGTASMLMEWPEIWLEEAREP